VELQPSIYQTGNWNAGSISPFEVSAEELAEPILSHRSVLCPRLFLPSQSFLSFDMFLNVLILGGELNETISRHELGPQSRENDGARFLLKF